MLKPELSIVIPTYNGGHKIVNLLKRLQTQDYKLFEVIVVIDGSTDNTAALLSQFQGQSPFALQVLETENKGRSHARNLGASKAVADLLVFFDDDMLPEPGCIRAHYDFINLREKTISIGTQITNIEGDNAPNDFYTYKKHLSLKGEQEIMAGPQPFEKKNLFLTSANFCIHKKDFETAGCFNETIRFQEDYELAKRCFDNGFKLYYNKAALAYHNEQISLSYLIRQENGYIRGRREVAQTPPVEGLTLFKQFLLTNLVRSIFNPDALDRRNYLVKLPKFVRFKLYSWIVYSYALTHK
jgi:glycosyltransferase involved in cell wall biosynthesis